MTRDVCIFMLDSKLIKWKIIVYWGDKNTMVFTLKSYVFNWVILSSGFGDCFFLVQYFVYIDHYMMSYLNYVVLNQFYFRL